MVNLSFVITSIFIHIYICVCLPSTVETVLSPQELSCRHGLSPISRTPRRVSIAPFRIRAPLQCDILRGAPDS
jgi:hypothetical protein